MFRLFRRPGEKPSGLGRRALLLCFLFLVFAAAFPGFAECAQVTLAWDPPPDTIVSGYKLYIGESSGDYSTFIDTGNVTSYTLTDLEDDHLYFFAATAYDEKGLESSFSNEVSYRTPPAPPVLLSIDIAGPLQVDEGASAEYSCTESLSDGSTRDVTDAALWSVNCTAAVISSGGLLTASSVAADSNCTITAAYEGKTDSQGITIKDTYTPGEDSPGEDEPPSSSIPRLELGEVGVDHNWKRVFFREAFEEPVVVATIVSANDPEPKVVRIRAVNSYGFDLRVQEWDYLDDSHGAERVSYMVMERGNYVLADGTMIEADIIETAQTASHGWVSFNREFGFVPVVVDSIITYNGSDCITGRLRNTSTAGFEHILQEQEKNAAEHELEEVAYIAWEPSTGNINGFSFEVGIAADNISDSREPVSYPVWFEIVPFILADIQSGREDDTATLQCEDRYPDSLILSVAEEESYDSETGHEGEIVGWMLFASEDPGADTDLDRLLTADEMTLYGTDPNQADTDADGLDDGDELEYWGPDWEADLDYDGTVNLLDSDSDNDGILDGEELLNGTDPGNTDPGAEIMLKLTSAWNLISLNRQPEDPAIATVLRSIADEVRSVWTYADEHWLVYDPANPGFSSLSTMEAGRGYWIFMENPAELNISGYSVPKTTELMAGWNLTGFKADVSMPVEEALASVEDDYVSVWSYEGGGWKVYDPANPDFSSLYTLEPGLGYFIKMRSACSWELP